MINVHPHDSVDDKKLSSSLLPCESDDNFCTFRLSAMMIIQLKSVTIYNISPNYKTTLKYTILRKKF